MYALLKIVLQQLWMNCQFLNCFSFRMIIYYFRSMPIVSRMTKLGHTTLWFSLFLIDFFYLYSVSKSRGLMNKWTFSKSQAYIETPCIFLLRDSGIHALGFQRYVTITGIREYCGILDWFINGLPLVTLVSCHVYTISYRKNFNSRQDSNLW